MAMSQNVVRTAHDLTDKAEIIRRIVELYELSGELEYEAKAAMDEVDNLVSAHGICWECVITPLVGLDDPVDLDMINRHLGEVAASGGHSPGDPEFLSRVSSA